MSKSRSSSLEQGELGSSPDLNINLDMVTEFDLRRDLERKRKRQEDELIDEHEDILSIKPPQVRNHDDEGSKKFRRTEDRIDERSKKRSNQESERLERLEKERKRLDNERHKHLDKIQKERDHERELTRKDKSGRMEEERRRNERRDYRSRPVKSSRDNDHHRKSRMEATNRTSSSSPPRKEEKKHKRKISPEVEMRIDDEGSQHDEVEDVKHEVDNSKFETLNTASPEKPASLQKYDHYHFARSKFDVDDDDDEEEDDETDSGKMNSQNNSNGKNPSSEERPSPSVNDKIETPPEDNNNNNVEENTSEVPDDIEPEHDTNDDDGDDDDDLPSYYPAIQGCRSVEEFHCLNRINEGTYGVVYRAVDLKLKKIVALKRLKLEKEKDGFPITSLREIKLLMMAKHPNVVAIKEVVVGSNLDKVYMVMEYVEHDLKSLMETMKDPFSIGVVKTLMIQLLRGVQHLHDNWIIHRDLKTSNLLLSHSGILKIADFGLAREYGSPLKPYSPVVVTLWYRCPELLLGTKMYSTAVDMWSIGCIFAEFLLRRPLFAGKKDIDQLSQIFKVLGSPNEDIWPGVKDLPVMQVETFTQYPFNQLRKKFEPCLLSDKGFQLMNSMLRYCPEKRMTADIALSHNYFDETPLPTHPTMFPTWPAKSELYKIMKSPKAPTGGKAVPKLDVGHAFH